jgi:C-terminal processing protease CtpA/Prc
MWFNQAAEGYTVVDVTKGGPADQAGLKAGDLMLSVDGKPVGDVPLYDLRRKLREAPVGTPVKLEIKSGDARRTVTLTLRDLLQASQ